MRGLQNVVVVSSLALAGATHAQNAVQWRVEDGGNGHWYAPTAQSLVYPSLRSACEQIGGHLATLTTQTEWQWVKTHFPVPYPQGRFVGAYQDHASPNYVEPNGGWVWVTGEIFVLDLSYMGSLTVGAGMTEPGFDDCPGGSIGLCGCGPSGAQDALFITSCCNNKLDDVGDGVVQNCDSEARLGIIEWSADCNKDGLVDYGQILAGTLADANQNNIPDCCEAGSPCPGSAVQWRVEDGGNGHWYLDETLTSMSFDARQQVCLANGAHLCTITSETEHQFVLSVVFPTGLLSPDATCWPTLGARHFANAPFHWVTGEPFVYAPFLTDQPQYWQEEHLRMWGLGLQAWLSFAGNASTNTCERAVIEYSADCNNDSIIDYGQIRAGDLIDANNNNIPDCCEPGASCDPCPGDVDESGAVNAVDLAAILNTWGSDGGKYPGADIDGNGTVDASDLTAVLSSWGACP